jgi:RecG-like helicase
MDLKSIKGIGPKTLEKLNANQIYSVDDLLLTFPKKYMFYNVDNFYKYLIIDYTIFSLLSIYIL